MRCSHFLLENKKVKQNILRNMASRSITRAHDSIEEGKRLVHLRFVLLSCFLTGSDLCTHALVDFIDEDCTGAIPLKHVVTETFSAGQTIAVCWNNKKEYAAVFLLQVRQQIIDIIVDIFIVSTLGSKIQCQIEENRILEEDEKEEDCMSEQDADANQLLNGDLKRVAVKDIMYVL